ncbi:hypothetical protein HK098_006398 [Nowakowskiella sp. JEL0407]|nr:hypothetical protein HK098_006398 [Nowakowskiella sp. JEL0407]
MAKESSLSTHVKQLFIIQGSPNAIESLENLSWETIPRISAVFSTCCDVACENVLEFIYTPQNSDTVLEIVKRTHVFFQHITNNFPYATFEEFWTVWSESFSCLGKEHINLLKFGITSILDKNDKYVGLLLLTVFIERVLGDSISSIESPKSVPNLLKDILRHPTVVSVLNDDLVFFLGILLGPPTTINLRNILWHGFAEEHDPSLEFSYRVYSRALISLVLNVSVAISTYDFKFTPRKLLQFEPDDINASLAINSNYFTQVCRNLPKLESELRRIYVTANNLDETWHLTAETNRFYLTLDILLDEFVIEPEMWTDVTGGIRKKNRTGKKNAALDVIGDLEVKIIHDIFTSDLGPRIRDRISHGMVSCSDSSIPEWLFTLTDFLFQQLINGYCTLGNKTIIIDQYTPNFDVETVYRNAVKEYCRVKKVAMQLKNIARFLLETERGGSLISVKSFIEDNTIPEHALQELSFATVDFTRLNRNNVRKAFLISKQVIEVSCLFAVVCEEAISDCRQEIDQTKTSSIKMTARKRNAIIYGAETACNSVIEVLDSFLKFISKLEMDEPSEKEFNRLMILSQKTVAVIPKGIGSVWRELGDP